MQCKNNILLINLYHQQLNNQFNKLCLILSKKVVMIRSRSRSRNLKGNWKLIEIIVEKRDKKHQEVEINILSENGVNYYMEMLKLEII